MATNIDYHFSATPNAVQDGVTVPYFVSHHFNTCQLVVSDQSIPTAALATLKKAGLNVIVDIEQVIWAGGQVTAPLSNFTGYFQALANAGVQYVSSEGGREGDLDVLKQYFKGYVNYNCDQCGLWKDFYSHPFTVMNSWESYYDNEWSYIQQGCKAGKKNGILAGCWTYGNPILTNSQNNSGLTYLGMADWMAANGGLNHWAIWAGINDGMLSAYKSLGFESIVSNLQAKYPPNGIGPAPPASITPASILSEIMVNTMRYEFILGSDKAIWYRTIDTAGKATAFVSLGGICTAGPKASVRGNGTIDVFVRGADTAGKVDAGLWHRSLTGSAWSGWQGLGGILLPGAAIESISTGTNSVSVYVQGVDSAHSVYVQTFDGTKWSGWSQYISKIK